jgi:hypothetical protein
LQFHRARAVVVARRPRRTVLRQLQAVVTGSGAQAEVDDEWRWRLDGVVAAAAGVLAEVGDEVGRAGVGVRPLHLPPGLAAAVVLVGAAEVEPGWLVTFVNCDPAVESRLIDERRSMNIMRAVLVDSDVGSEFRQTDRPGVVAAVDVLLAVLPPDEAVLHCFFLLRSCPPLSTAHPADSVVDDYTLYT